jgi:hypothetical protein
MSVLAVAQVTVVLVGVIVASAVLLGAGGWYLADELSYRRRLRSMAAAFEDHFSPELEETLNSHTSRLEAAKIHGSSAEVQERATAARSLLGRADEDPKIALAVGRARALPVDAIPLLSATGMTRLHAVVQSTAPTGHL